MSVEKKHSASSTISDFLTIDEDRRFHELLGGEIVEKAAPSGEHGAAQSYLAARLIGPFSRRLGGHHPGGWWFATEVEIRFGKNVCRPDVAGWRRERVPDPPRGKMVDLLPDWTCEILSSDNARNDLVRKKHIYYEHRVGHYWIADPQQGVLLVYRWVADGYLEVLSAERGERVRAEPFEAIELQVGTLFGDDEDGDEQR